MDGIKKRLADSVQLRLSVGLCAAIAVVAVLTGTIAFFSALDEAHELQDSSLSQIAVLVENGTLQAKNSNFISTPIHDEKGSQVIVHFMFSPSRYPPEGRDNDFALPYGLENGFHALRVGEHVYRVLINTLGPDTQVGVAQRVSVRDEVAMASAWRTLMPFLLVMPVLLLVVADLVKKIFRPIRTLSAEVNRRDERNIQPLALDGLPREIKPFIIAINQLLSRVALSVEQQRRFVADAAHELRSPLTALTLQAERLAAAELPGAARERVDKLQQGMQRTKYLLEQLLTLARAQLNNAPTLNTPPVNVNKIMRQAMEDLMPLAERKSIDLGVADADSVVAQYDEVDLFTLIKNLVDNAIRYTPV